MTLLFLPQFYSLHSERMKNWEDMKEFSYVGIKLTKAHSITEGLKRCQKQSRLLTSKTTSKVQKNEELSRVPAFSLNSNAKKQKSQHQAHHTYSMTEPFIKTSSSQNKFNSKKYSHIQNQKLCIKKQMISAHSQRNQIEIGIQDFTNKIEGLTSDFRKIKSAYLKFDTDRTRLQQKFLRDTRELEIGIDQDLGINLEELTKNKSIFRSSLEHKKLKMKKDNQKVKQLNKRVMFPFSHSQVESIVHEDKKSKQNIEVKSNKMIRSIYDYKSSVNYSNRMNTIKTIIQQ